MTGSTADCPALPEPPSGVTAAKDFAVYDVMTGGERSDLWKVRWSGGTPVRLTTDGSSRDPRAASASDVVAWERGNTGLAADDFARPGLPLQLKAPIPYGPDPGHGFVAYLAGATIQAAALTPYPRALKISNGDADVTTRLAVSGDEVAFGESLMSKDGSDQVGTLLRVVRVSRSA